MPFNGEDWKVNFVIIPLTKLLFDNAIGFSAHARICDDVVVFKHKASDVDVVWRNVATCEVDGLPATALNEGDNKPSCARKRGKRFVDIVVCHHIAVIDYAVICKRESSDIYAVKIVYVKFNLPAIIDIHAHIFNGGI